MGFWHTGYLEHHEPTGWMSSAPIIPLPPQYPCERCGVVFSTREDHDVHVFDGHATARPILLLRGRECGRSRHSVIRPTTPEDWVVQNAVEVLVNGNAVAAEALGAQLSRMRSGVVSVELIGAQADQVFDFSFSIADEQQLERVDRRLAELIAGRSLSLHAIDQFIERCREHESARRYRDGFATYLFGVLARDRAPESGLRTRSAAQPAYVTKFNEAVAILSDFDRPPAEAVCGLVAFHYNHFDVALRKTRSPRVARAARRLQSLLAGTAVDERGSVGDRSSLDYVLSDSETEQVLSWCCIQLDGTAQSAVHDMERALVRLEPSDQIKLRVIAAEHHLAAGAMDSVEVHLSALRHSRDAELWISSVRERREGLRA